MSDNGACAEWEPFGFEYPDYNSRISGSTPNHPNILHKGKSLELLGGPDGPLFSFGSGWANACNTPFSFYKQYVHEGGISSPLIIHWPDKIKAPVLFNENYAHFTDIMATCVEVAGANYPDTFNGKKITPMEGISLFKTLNKEAGKGRVLCFEHMGKAAIRVGDWKLVCAKKSFINQELKTDAPFKLYNIATDRSETNDLSSKYPEKVKELKQLMQKEFKRTYVLPKPCRK